MHNQEEIMLIQNEERMLKCQYAARACFNQAEIANHVSWGLAFIASFTVLIQSDSYVWTIIPAVLDVVILLCNKFVSDKVADAALLRNYFDFEVLHVIPDQYSEARKSCALQKMSEICYRNKDKCALSIQNTSQDTPLGVKNWYEFSSTVPCANAVYECQRQNAWWNKQLSENRNTLCNIILVILAIFGCITISTLHFSVVNVVACFFGLVVNLYDFIKANKYYMNISLKLDGIINAPGISWTPDTLSYIQELICTRREAPVLEFNLIHRARAKYLSELYKDSHS